MKKSPLAGSVGLVVLTDGDTMNSNSPAPGGLLMLGSSVSTAVLAGMDAIWIVPLVMQEMSGSPLPRMSVTPVTAMLLLFFTVTPSRTLSPASANASLSPFRSRGALGRTMSCGSGTFLQEMMVLNDTASSGMPLLSSSRVSGGSQISPRPSWSLSAWRNVPGMIGGLGVFGQSSMLSGTPSPSASSCTGPQEPSFTTPSLWQVCGTKPTHVWFPGHDWLVRQKTEVFTLQ